MADLPTTTPNNNNNVKSTNIGKEQEPHEKSWKYWRSKSLVHNGTAKPIEDGGFGVHVTFCDILRSVADFTTVAAVLDAIRAIYDVIYEVLTGGPESSPTLDDEKSVSFDVVYYSLDTGKIRSVVELEKLRNTDSKRHSRALLSFKRNSRLSFQSLSSEAVSVFSEDIIINGLPMVTRFVSGHALCLLKAIALADVLREHDSILELHIGKTNIRGIGMSHISAALVESYSVRVLDLRLNNIGNEGAAHLFKALTSNKKLRQLNLSSTGIDADGVNCLAYALRTNVGLEDLDLSFLDIGDSGYLPKTTPNNNNNAKSTNIGKEQEPHEKSWKFWRSLSTRRSRKSLLQNGTAKPIEDGGFGVHVTVNLPDVVDNTDVSPSKLVDPPLKPPRSSVELLGQKVDPFMILDKLAETQLLDPKALNIYKNPVDSRYIIESVVQTVMDSEYPTFLQFCDILRSVADFTTVAAVLDTGKIRSVVELEKLRNTESKRHSRDLLSFKRNSRLSFQSLSSEASSVFSEDIIINGLPMVTISVSGHALCLSKAIADVLRAHDSILELHIGKTHIRGTDMSHISAALVENYSVRVLDLRLNNIGNEGAAHLVKALTSNKTLRQLNLSSTGIDADGVNCLADALRTNVGLEDLD
ncbi:protein NLRC3-like [Dreissena polymorpha]|nr:protein NLRC3-like [Dreissena polymorpha]